MANSKRTGIVLLALCGAIVAAVALLARRSAAEGDRIKALAGEIQRIKAEAADREVDRAREAGPERPNIANLLGAIKEQSEAVNRPAAHEPELAPEDRDRKLLAINKTRSALCDRKYDEETSDSQWSAGAVQAIRAKYSGEGLEGAEIAVECKTTLCKIDVSFPDPATALSLAKKVFTTTPWPSRRFDEFNIETRKGRSYVAREGHDLPEPDLNNLAY